MRCGLGGTVEGGGKGGGGGEGRCDGDLYVFVCGFV